MKTVKVSLFICVLLTGLAFADVGSKTNLATTLTIPPVPTDLFSPSNARTENGEYIPVEQFFPASRCANCHADTHAGWSQSLHRNAAREPFYRESADILLNTRGIEFTRHCESCHTPVALLSGMLVNGSGKNVAPFTPLDDEGVTCVVCHSITEARLDGTGSFTIRRPALLAQEDGTPIFGNFSDEEILADVPAHKRAVMRPLLKKPEFCATCHKVTVPPALNGYKQLPGFSAYDEWQQSGSSLESVLPYYRKAARLDCRSCHMPKVASTNDRAAKEGMIVLHRWPGANTAAPLFYSQNEQVELTQRFLQANVLNVDIFSVKSEVTGQTTAPLTAEKDNPIVLKPGEEITVEVVVSNRNAAHSFPPEVRDLYESWVEFEAVDASGKRVFQSGFLKPDGMLDEGAHVYKSILLDESGRTITRHQIWLIKQKAFDNAIQAGRSDVVRYSFRLPKDAKAGAFTIRARVKYRRFNQEYTNYVLKRQNKDLSVPVIQMAEAKTIIRIAKSTFVNPGPADVRRWNDYGIGLMEQAQYGAAAAAFLRASELDPLDPNLLTNAAIAEMRTERFGPERSQLLKAEILLEQALKIDPKNSRARFYRALVWRGQGKMKEAADELAVVARQYPRDREVQRQLGQTLYTLGQLTAARTAFETLLSIDPNDSIAYRLIAPIYASEGRISEAEKATALHLLWRDDPYAEAVSTRFFTAHPEWREERISSHQHNNSSASRPVLTGKFAAPDK
jgi:tetratricopeptide (TPR) repeat protein